MLLVYCLGENAKQLVIRNLASLVQQGINLVPLDSCLHMGIERVPVLVGMQKLLDTWFQSMQVVTQNGVDNLSPRCTIRTEVC